MHVWIFTPKTSMGNDNVFLKLQEKSKNTITIELVDKEIKHICES